MRIKNMLEREIEAASLLMAQQGKINPMIAVHKSGEIVCFPLLGNDFRHEARILMDKIREIKYFDYAVFMAEAWQRTYPKDFDASKIQHGDLQKLADVGDESVKAILMIQVYTGSGEKLAAMFDIEDGKLTNKLVFDKFTGYLDFEGMS